MDFVWDPAKNAWLEFNRGISFEQVAEVFLNGQQLDILKSPSRGNQYHLAFGWNDYTWIAPFVIDEQERIVLKTAYPSRKLHKRYGGRR